jgi:hypothetical protein
MANSKLGLVLTLPSALVPLSLSNPKGDARQEAEILVNTLMGLASGAKIGSLSVSIGGNQASGTLTLASSVSGDTIALAGTTFTEVASGAGTHQFNQGANDSATAANLASAINADATLSLSYIATSSGPVVTITALAISTSGNSTTLVGSAHITASASTLRGGVNPTSTALYHYGL